MSGVTRPASRVRMSASFSRAMALAIPAFSSVKSYGSTSLSRFFVAALSGTWVFTFGDETSGDLRDDLDEDEDFLRSVEVVENARREGLLDLR